MHNVITVTDFEDPRLDAFARLTEAQLRSRIEPEKGIFIAESPKVIDRALDAGYEPVSLLMESKHVEGQAAGIIERCEQRQPGIPVYTGSLDTLCQLTGFKLTRGVLCAFRRAPLPSVEELLAGTSVLAGSPVKTGQGAVKTGQAPRWSCWPGRRGEAPSGR